MYSCNRPGDSFFSMALSYIEVGRVAASASTSIKSLGDYENAVAYQLFHALELFYKSMISNAGQSVKHTHDLCELESQYKACFSDPHYYFENPFDFSSYESNPLNPNEMQLVQSHREKFKPTYMSQHLRYPPDYRTGGYSFGFDESFFTGMKEKLQTIYEMAANKSLQPTAFGGG